MRGDLPNSAGSLIINTRERTFAGVLRRSTYSRVISSCDVRRLVFLLRLFVRSEGNVRLERDRPLTMLALRSYVAGRQSSIQDPVHHKAAASRENRRDLTDGQMRLRIFCFGALGEHPKGSNLRGSMNHPICGS